jgi:3-oxoadipate enol-lactonase
VTWLTANGIRQHVQRMPATAVPPGHGGRPVVVFIHGLGTDSLASCYFTLAGPLAEAGIDVVMYDLRGHGRSDKPDTGYTVDHFVEDLAGLLGSIGVAGPVHLIGNSFGGTIAFSYVLRYPDDVASVVMIESEPATQGWSVKMTDLLGRAASQLTRGEAPGWLTEHFGEHTSRLARAAGHALHETSMSEEIPLGPLLTEDHIHSVRHPVLAIYGSLSDLVPVGVRMGGQLVDCTVAQVPGRDHSVLVEAPTEILRLVLSWLAGDDDRHGPSAEPGDRPGSALTGAREHGR